MRYLSALLAPVAASWLTLVLVPAGVAEPASLQAKPYAPRKASSASTRFEALPADVTGIDVVNRYDDPRMWREKYLEFTLGAFGTGTAIGDYDGDGRPDIFVTTKTGHNHLYRNLGDFHFKETTDAAGVAGPADTWSQGATFADVNNDGWLDIYVCRYAAPNLLYINHGDGTFTEEASARGLAVKDASGQAAFADFDRDGFLDVYVQTNLLDIEASPTGQRDYLFRNNGDGTFSDVTAKARISGEAQGHSATWWDYDDDGWPDLYVANDFKDPDKLYHNNGDGTFTNDLSRALPHTPHSSMGADLGDVNNDGWIDLLVADMATPSRYKDHRGMAKVRAGLPDADQTPTSAQQYMRNALLLNNGTGRMQEAAFLAGLDATDWTWSVRLEDLDNDGWVDAFFTNGMIRELHNADLVTKMGTFESRADRVRLMRQAPPLNERNLVFRNRGKLQFEDVSKNWGLDHEGISLSAAFGDLDGDGDLDLVVASLDEPFLVYRNNTSTGNSLTLAFEGTMSNRYGVGVRVLVESTAGTQARSLVLSRGYMSSDEPALHFGLGDASAAQRVVVRWPSGMEQTLENVAANARYLIKEPLGKVERGPVGVAPAGQFTDVTDRLGLGQVVRDRGADELARQPLLSIRQNRVGPAAAVVDLDNDGRLDVVIGGATGEAARVFSSLDGTIFTGFGLSGVPPVSELPDGPMLFLDVNGDGFPDLLSTKAGTARPAADPRYAVRLFYNDGGGRFAAAPADAMPVLSGSFGAAAAADWDHDGDLDVFLGARVAPGEYPKTPYSFLLLGQGGRFSLADENSVPGLHDVGMVTSAVWSDADGDGWVDLVIATEWNGVHLFRNEEGKRLVDVSTPSGFSQAGHGWWSSVASGDFNGDGVPDYAVGNVGLNTPYRASPEQPALLLRGAFDPSGKKQNVEVSYFEGKRYPLRGLPQLSAALPSLARKFLNFESYAKAPLEDVFSEETLKAAEQYTATEFRSGIFLSQGNGTWRFDPLPREAQLAPINGMVASDLDGDGKLDLAFVGNTFAPIPEFGRFDGGIGLILKGDGRGHLLPEPPAKSGFVVPGHAEALAAADFDNDGWIDLLATRHGDRTVAWHNERSPNRNSFAVHLRGKPGNPTAAGAKVTVRYADGSSLNQEQCLGGTRLAQSIAILFFGYTDTNLPVSLDVRWPDGQSSSYPWQGQTAPLDLQQP